MQVLITHDSLARTRVLRLARWQWAAAAAGVVALMLLFSGAVYHMVFLKAARDGWPIIGQLVRLVVRDEVEQQDRYMRANLDAMAQKVGEMQAKLIKLEAMGERVARVANVKPEDIAPLQRPAPAASASGLTAPAPPTPISSALPVPGEARGTVSGASLGASLGTGVGAGAYGGLASTAQRLTAVDTGAQGGPYVPDNRPSLQILLGHVQALDEATDFNIDLYTLFESRLLDSQQASVRIASEMPLDTGYTSGFGFRSDPFTGRQALHTGLDFPAETGTNIRAAAAGIVVNRETHPAYGEMVEIDHGSDLITRYAHCSAIDVKVGQVVRKGQVIARVGTTGRSTGPHLHFEVLVKGVHRDPVRFLAGLDKPALPEFAARPELRAVARP